MNSTNKKKAALCVTSTQDSREREKYGYYHSRTHSTINRIEVQHENF